MIKDLKDGSSADGQYLVKDATKGVTTTGLNYLNITLQDSSGTIEAKKWDISKNDLEIFANGNFIKVQGDVNLYRNSLQVKVYGGSLLDKGSIKKENFVICGPTSFEDLKKKFDYYLDSIKDLDCKAILNEIFNEKLEGFLEYPAAVTFHHEFYHGLLHHSLGMCDVAEGLTKLYTLNRDLLITGCLLHDIGKLEEFSGVIGTSYTKEGSLLGHIHMGASLVNSVAKKLNITSNIPLLLEHMILSHHGKLEFGAVVVPSTKEAFVLSLIDELDSKMMVIDKAYKNVKSGDFTDRIYALDGTRYFKD
ncbi:MAG TPA: HD domain-containing protein [Candidatus Onthovivens sp.]|nr:HD domain-containing protein [Candidatus Onthovivens sp.]